MMYIDLTATLNSVPQAVKDTLAEQSNALTTQSDAEKKETIKNGSEFWTPVRQFFETVSNRKCWYTESRNPGCVNDIDHFRPKAEKTRTVRKHKTRLYWYWFLTFAPTNFRLSCHIANRRTRNPDTDVVGGKGTKFPLLPPGTHGTTPAEVTQESPKLLDPIVRDDCRLIAFQPDGRPVIAPDFKDDTVARDRVETSKLLLNLDFPTFNEDREKLYNDIKREVTLGDQVREIPDAFRSVQDKLRECTSRDAEYSAAARCYLRCFRDRDWVDELVAEFDSAP